LISKPAKERWPIEIRCVSAFRSAEIKTTKIPKKTQNISL
jgi:hypothetical protein